MSDLVPADRYPPPQPSGSPAYAPEAAHFSAEGEGEGVGIRDLIDVLRRRKWLILGITLLAVPLAYLAASRVPPTYRAGAVVRVAQQDMTALTGGLGDPWVERMLGSQLHLVRTRRVIAAAVDGHGLRLTSATRAFSVGELEGITVDPEAAPDTIRLHFSAQGVVASNGIDEVQAVYGVPLEIGGVRFTVPRAPRGENAVLTVQPREETISTITWTLRARPRDRSDIIDIDYTAPDPVLAQRVVNAVVETFHDVSLEVAKQQVQRRREFIEDQLARTDAELHAAQQALTSFRSREQVFNMGEKYAAGQGVLTGLDLEREQLAADLRHYQQVLAELRRPRTGGSISRHRVMLSAPGLSANPLLAQLYGQLANYETEREVLTSGPAGSSPTNPNVQRLDALIASTEAKLVEALASHISRMESQLASIDARRSSQVAAVERLPALALEEFQLVQRVEAVQARANLLQAEYQRVQLSEAVQSGMVEIVDAASTSSPDLTWPQRVFLLGILLGLAAGGGTAFVVEKLQGSIRRREEVETVLQVPVLGIIPPIASATATRRNIPLLGAITRAAPHGKHNGNGKGKPTSLVKLSDLRSSPAEAYRTLRTNLMFSQAIQSLRTLVVTSAMGEEGKSTTAANLAMAMAQQGMRVLLVGGDLRRPRIERMFGVPKKPGLTDLLLERKTREEAIRPTRLPGLDLLPCGVAAPNGSELLGGLRARALLETLAEQYDMVLIDTPPLLAGADAAVLGALADGVLMVVRAGATKRASAQQAMRQLATVGARVVGAVLNDPDTQVPPHEAYYGYYAKYYSAEVEEEESVAVH